jgi:hypothetical protein
MAKAANSEFVSHDMELGRRRRWSVREREGSGGGGNKVRSQRTVQFVGMAVVVLVGNSCINFPNEFTRIIFD